MLDYIVMQMRKVNRQKGYWMAYIENTSGSPFFSRVRDKPKQQMRRLRIDAISLLTFLPTVDLSYTC